MVEHDAAGRGRAGSAVRRPPESAGGPARRGRARPPRRWRGERRRAGGLRAADVLVRLAGGEESDAVRTARAAARNALGRIQGLINAVRDQIEQEEGFQREQPTRRAEKAYPFREHNSTLARSWKERRTAD